MEHLTIEEIIEFVSFEKMDAESLKLASRVNAHIRSCPSCMRKVRAFQLVMEELSCMGKRATCKSVARQKVSKEL